MNLKNLPNYAGLIHLYRQHYVEGPGEQLDDDHTSSHWRFYKQTSRITVDGDGNLLWLEGKGFGGYQQERFFRRLADYLCCGIHFLQAENKRDLFNLMKTAIALTKKIPFGAHYLSYDLFRQVHALTAIRQHFYPEKGERFVILVIGDGFGFLTALAKTVFPQASFVLVDLGRTLFFQCLYLQMLYPERTHHVVGDEAEKQQQGATADFLYCPTGCLEHLQSLRYRLAVNVCSMQEMTVKEIERYFQYLRSHMDNETLFYCCNRESKVLPDGEKVDFSRYPWLPADRHLVDGYPSVYRFWFSSRRKGNGPKLWGRSIPFVDGPDGPVRHRLTVLSKEPLEGSTVVSRRTP